MPQGNLWIETQPAVNQMKGRLRDRGSQLQVQLEKVANHLADAMAEAARDLVAKEEQKVAKSIRVERRSDAWTVVADRGGERDEVAVYLEVGTHKMAPRPYMVPAERLVLASGGLYKAMKAAGGLLGQTNI